MKKATHEDIVRLFPGLQDHAASEILGLEATVDELDAVLVLLSSEDRELAEIKRREGARIHQLVDILNQAGIEAVEDRD